MRRKLMNNKRGESELGVWVITLVRLVFAFVLLAMFSVVSSFSYEYTVSLRSSEALVLNTVVAQCLIHEGIVDLERQDSLASCFRTYDGRDRLYLKAVLKNVDGTIAEEFDEGDSGALWVQDLFLSNLRTREIERYRPGYYFQDYEVRMKQGGRVVDGILEVETLVKYVDA